MPVRARLFSDESGFSLIEALVASAITLVGLTATMGLVDKANTTTQSTRAREQATALQREVVEVSRAVPYDLITPNTLGEQVRLRPALSDASAGQAGWTIRRRNTTYTVSLGVCAVDDPRDGIGPHKAGEFCATGAGAATPAQCSTWLNAIVTGVTPVGASLGDCGIDLDADGDVDDLTSPTATVCIGDSCGGSTLDTVPTDYKRIVSLVRWTEAGQAKWNVQTSTINNPGLAAAPAVTSLSVLDAVVTAGTSLAFSALASPTPRTVGFYVDGTQKGTASTATGAAWLWTWEMGAVSSGAQPTASETVDGAYVVSAKAFDEYGQFGQSRSQTITVNRRIPFAPPNVEAGRNGSGVDVEWSPGPDRDLEGYRVYRRAPLGTWSEACALTTRSSCRDDAAPPGVLEYSVMAVDRDATGALREGDRSAVATVNLTNTAPPAPASLSASLSNGNVVLSWPAPGADPDPGDSIDHFNIYRDGQLYDDRYDRTATGSTLTYTDTKTLGTTHTYWITSVDTQLAESVQVGPVTR